MAEYASQFVHGGVSVIHDNGEKIEITKLVIENGIIIEIEYEE